nr:helix-turn-helix transcriptional regulator [uncultured Desulfobulbus sp.]
MSNKINLKTDNIGLRLLSYRQDKGLTGKQFAEIIGISQGSLSELENGKRDPSGKVFQGLVENTDIDISWLITGKQTEKLRIESSKIGKFEILNQVEEWLSEIVKENPKKEVWFEVEFEEKFQEFKKWKEEKENQAIERDYATNRKVA